MSVRVVADGVIVEGPERVDSDRAVTAFILGTRQEIDYRGQRIALDDVATCEVVCSGDLATAAASYQQGDRVLVAGVMRTQQPPSASGEVFASQFVRIEIHAESIGRL